MFYEARTRHLSLRSEGGETVSAIATTPDAPNAAYVFAHGAGAGMAHPFMSHIADGLADRHVACLRYQFPYMEAGKRRVDSAAVAQATVRIAAALASELWPGTPLFAGGKSFGGRMTSQAQSAQPLPGVHGLAFLGFPLHLAGKPSTARADHLAAIRVPMLFVRGTRDVLAEASHFDEVMLRLEKTATRVDIAEADHGFEVLCRSGRNRDEVLEEVLNAMVHWMALSTTPLGAQHA
ncbi:MAG: alpha/beta family hydrolase [Burkholderiaceae bacterium]